MKLAERAQEIEKIKNWLGSGSINIFGLPFAGKDTHSQELASQLDGIILGGGDILRNSVVPEHVQSAINQGKLVPTDDYVRIVLPYLSREEFSGKPLILSSVGRWHGEEPGVLEAASASDHPIKAVIFLNIKQSVALERWKDAQIHKTRGERTDDAHHLLDVRFAEFNAKTLPVIDFYRDKGLLIEIDGTPEVPLVSQKILDELLVLSHA